MLEGRSQNERELFAQCIKRQDVALPPSTVSRSNVPVPELFGFASAD